MHGNIQNLFKLTLLQLSIEKGLTSIKKQTAQGCTAQGIHRNCFHWIPKTADSSTSKHWTVQWLSELNERVLIGKKVDYTECCFDISISGSQHKNIQLMQIYPITINNLCIMRSIMHAMHNIICQQAQSSFETMRNRRLLADDRDSSLDTADHLSVRFRSATGLHFTTEEWGWTVRYESCLRHSMTNHAGSEIRGEWQDRRKSPCGIYPHVDMAAGTNVHGAGTWAQWSQADIDTCPAGSTQS